MGNNKITKAAQLFLSSPRGNVVFLIIVASLILLLNLNGWGLWSPDEPRQAQVAEKDKIGQRHFVLLAKKI
jgi:hypothetical protein